jgi:hypothetical protein
MAILQELLNWSKQIPLWQNDALVRLFGKQDLTVEDVDELYLLLKADHGIQIDNKLTAKRLSADQIPAPTQNSTHIELLAIKNLRQVNAIAENQRLPINSTGLTVIYGDNGSGKSGYSRVLKRACRARDQSEPIHPNAHIPVSETGTAEATFEISINGSVKEVQWVNGNGKDRVS